MNAITKILTISFVAFTLLTYVGAAALDIHKISELFGAMRSLQSMDVCSTETNAATTCLSESGTTANCGGCLSNLANTLFAMGPESTCDSLKGTVCSDLRACFEKGCPEPCHDELHAIVACSLQEGGCNGNECSPGFKAMISVASAAGAAVIGWMLM